MKKNTLIWAFIVLLSLPGPALADPFLGCDPQDNVEYYQIVMDGNLLPTIPYNEDTPRALSCSGTWPP